MKPKGSAPATAGGAADNITRLKKKTAATVFFFKQ
jgi:hypothetical protein